MKKEIFKKIKKGIYHMDNEYNWHITTKDFIIIDKNFQHNEESFKLYEDEVKNIIDILGGNVFVKLKGIKNLEISDKNSRLAIKDFAKVNLSETKFERDYLIHLDEERLDLAKKLVTELKPTKIIDISTLVGFVENYVYRTDTYRLGYFTLENSIGEKKISLDETVIDLLILIQDKNILVEIDYSRSLIRITTENYIIYTQYKELVNPIPLINQVNNEKSKCTTLNFNRIELINVLKVCDKIAVSDVDNKHKVIMRGDTNKLTLYSSNSRMNISKDILLNNTVPTNVDVAFNSKFLIECLSTSMKDLKDINILYQNGHSKLFCENKNYTYIFMPMKID